MSGKHKLGVLTTFYGVAYKAFKLLNIPRQTRRCNGIGKFVFFRLPNTKRRLMSRLALPIQRRVLNCWRKKMLGVIPIAGRRNIVGAWSQVAVLPGERLHGEFLASYLRGIIGKPVRNGADRIQEGIHGPLRQNALLNS